MIRKPRFDQFQHGFCDFAGQETPGTTQGVWATLPEIAAIVVIEVPLSAGWGAVRFHEQPGALPQFAVEEFHAQAFAAFGVSLELSGSTQKMGILTLFQQHSSGSTGVPQRFPDMPFTGPHHHHFFRFQVLERISQFRRQRTAIRRIIEGAVLQRPPPLPDGGGVVPHATEKDRDACLV